MTNKNKIGYIDHNADYSGFLFLIYKYGEDLYVSQNSEDGKKKFVKLDDEDISILGNRIKYYNFEEDKDDNFIYAFKVSDELILTSAAEIDLINSINLNIDKINPYGGLLDEVESFYNELELEESYSDFVQRILGEKND